MTQHRLFIDRERLLVTKLPGAHPNAVSDLSHEPVAYRCLGIETQPVGEGFSMPYLGSVCEPWMPEDEACLPQLWSSLRTIRASAEIPRIATWADRVHGKITARLLPGSPLRHRLLSDLDGVDADVLAGQNLVHTDPHPGNIVRRDDGRLFLIDWETCFAGDPDVTQACWRAIRTQQPWRARHRLEYVAGTLKAASLASWQAVHGSENEAFARYVISAPMSP